MTAPPRGNDNVTLFLVQGELCTPTVFSSLSKTQQGRAKMMSGNRRREYQTARWLLRHALHQHLGDIDLEEIAIEDRENLPPFSPQAEAANLHFSISHSGEYVGVAVSSSSRIGLDLEDASKQRRFEQIAEQFCNPRERQALFLTSPEQDKRAYFYALWTRKEAYLKYHLLGIGSTPMGDINFIPFDNNVNTGCVKPAPESLIATCCLSGSLQISLVCKHKLGVNLIELDENGCSSSQTLNTSNFISFPASLPRP